MTLSEFLRARIAEDEQGASDLLASTGRNADRTYAECEAKRRIVEMHDGPHYCSGRHVDLATGLNDPCATVQRLAVVYAEHPDYRDEWKP